MITSKENNYKITGASIKLYPFIFMDNGLQELKIISYLTLKDKKRNAMYI
jgi:hypothetical protein